MISEKEIKNIIAQVLAELGEDKSKEDVQEVVKELVGQTGAEVAEDDLVDITATIMQDIFDVPNPVNQEEYMKLKKPTPARLGIYRTGSRYLTKTFLRFRADHAVAMDAVWSDVSDEFLKEVGLFSVTTQVHDKDEFITRPDLGRKFHPEAIQEIKEKCKAKPRVQIYVSDGLSSISIEANVKDTLPAIIQGLEADGIEVGTPFFVKYGRVGAMDAITEALDAEVTAVLIGERPGLATGESMSCYLTYKGFPGMPEARRTVVSNIHKNGTPAAEAGAHIAGIIKKMLEAKASGLDLKL